MTSSKCDKCGEIVTDLDAGFCPGQHEMGHGCGGTWRVWKDPLRSCPETVMRAGRAVGCGQPAVEVRLSCPAGRPDAVAGYCDEHGGQQRARAEAERDWMYVAPASVGGPVDVEEAGTDGLRSTEAYVVIRQTLPATGGRWLAWLGIGSHMISVANPNAAPSRRGGRRNRSPGSDGTRAFLTEEDALLEAKRAWRLRVDLRVREITEARGGTLSWGTHVEPLDEPIVIRLEQGDTRSAWDVVEQLERRGVVGLGQLTGLRPTGEAL